MRRHHPSLRRSAIEKSRLRGATDRRQIVNKCAHLSPARSSTSFGKKSQSSGRGVAPELGALRCRAPLSGHDGVEPVLIQRGR
jgi:hypothetical protein